jgi:chemotaxis protein MotB
VKQVSRRRGRRHHEEPENQERWLITYSDLITLLMIFFVIMYAMSKVDVAKFMTLTQSLAAALHNEQKVPLKNLGTTGLVVPANPTNQGDKTQHPIPPASTAQTQNDKALDNLYTQVKAYISMHNLNGNVTIVNQQRGVQITLRDVVLFNTGQATILPQAQKLLQGLVPFFQSLNNPIVIEGYTDDVPISTSQFPSNWELSGTRAMDVVRFLVSQGISPPRLSGVGYGQYHPVVPNTSATNRAMNRRVNIVILRTVQSTQIVGATSNSANGLSGGGGSTGSAAGGAGSGAGGSAGSTSGGSAAGGGNSNSNSAGASAGSQAESSASGGTSSNTAGK